MLLLLILFAPLITAQRSQSCGTMQAFFTTDSRIVGGEPAANYRLAMASLYRPQRQDSLCGGTLIDHTTCCHRCTLYYWTI